MWIEKVRHEMKNKHSNLIRESKMNLKKTLQKAAMGTMGVWMACLVGCAGNPVIPSDYVKNGSPGTKVEVPLAEIVERQNNGEQMLVLFVQDGCSYCEAFDEVVDEYIQDHHIELNVVNLTTEEAYNSKEDIKSVLNAVVGGVGQTPALYYIESKDDVYLLDYTDGDYTEESLSGFVEKYQLDRVKEDGTENQQAESGQ